MRKIHNFPTKKASTGQYVGLKEHRETIENAKNFFSKHENILTLSPEELRLIQGIISGKGGKG